MLKTSFMCFESELNSSAVHHIWAHHQTPIRQSSLRDEVGGIMLWKLRQGIFVLLSYVMLDTPIWKCAIRAMRAGAVCVCSVVSVSYCSQTPPTPGATRSICKHTLTDLRKDDRSCQSLSDRWERQLSMKHRWAAFSWFPKTTLSKRVWKCPAPSNHYNTVLDNNWPGNNMAYFIASSQSLALLFPLKIAFHATQMQTFDFLSFLLLRILPMSPRSCYLSGDRPNNNNKNVVDESCNKTNLWTLNWHLWKLVPAMK